MNITMSLAYLLYNAARIIIVCRLGSLFFSEERFDKKCRRLLILSYIIINSFVYILTDNPNINLLVNLIMYIIFTFSYYGTVFHRLFSFIAGYIINMLCEGGVYFVVLNFSLPKEQTMLLSFLSIDVVFFIIEEILRFVFKRDLYDDIELKYKIFLLIIPFGSLYVCKIILDSYNVSAMIISAIVILLMINVSVFFILMLVTNAYKRLHEQDMINREYKYYKEQLRMIQENNEKVASTRHDYKNHSLTVKSYIHEGDLKKAEEYIDEFVKNISCTSNIVKSGNKIVDNIFNYKLGRLSDINMNIDITIPDELFIPDYDVSILIGNLLDNALNALQKTEEKTLEVSIKYKLKALHIRFSNSYSGEIIKKGNRFITTKKDKRNHGYGIKNIEEVVNKYGGNIDYIIDNGIFTVKILICNTISQI